MPFCPLEFLGLLPKRLHFFQAHVLQPAFGSLTFDVFEALFKLGIGARQSSLGLYFHKTGVIDQAEKQVAKLFFHFFLPFGKCFCLRCLIKLLHLFPHLIPHGFRIVPVEARLCGFFLHTLGFHQSRQGVGHALEDRALALFELELLPVFLDLLLIIGLPISVNVRMATDELLTFPMNEVGHIKSALFLCDTGIKDEMQHEVSQLFFDVLHVFFQEGIGQFVGLLYGEVAQALEGLFAVPGTLLAQGIHDLKQAGKSLGFGAVFFFHACKGTAVFPVFISKSFPTFAAPERRQDKL